MVLGTILATVWTKAVSVPLTAALPQDRERHWKRFTVKHRLPVNCFSILIFQ